MSNGLDDNLISLIKNLVEKEVKVQLDTASKHKHTFIITEEDNKVTENVYTLVGVREFKEIQDSCEHGTSEMTQYIVFLSQGAEDNKKLFSFTARNIYGDCMSGYTSATWGEFTNIESVDHVGTLHYVPKDKNLKVKYINDTESDDVELRTLDGESVINCSVNGGDGYYPCGNCSLNYDFFNETERAVEIRPVYLFSGPSKIGKSFIASHLDGKLDVYETDVDNTIPNDIAKYHVIVIGNKYPSHKEQVYSVLKDNKEITIVDVRFHFSH
jgi:hypothetical protein